MEDLTKILEDDDNINEDEIKKYLSGNLSDEEKHSIEKKIADSPFTDDAVEGLQNFSSHQKLDEYVNHLNEDLHQYLAGKKELKEKRKIKDLSWIIVAVIIILLLCLLGYVVVKMQRDRQIQRNSISVQNIRNPNNRGSNQIFT